MSAAQRLRSEQKNYRKNPLPLPFYARMAKSPDGSKNAMQWEAAVPGKAGTPWEGGVYKIQLFFPEDYPTLPPQVNFNPIIFHPNVYSADGKICLSIINDPRSGGTWKPAITIPDILKGVQDLLDNPNNDDPAATDPFLMYKSKRKQYDQKIREQAKNMK